jgi:3-methyl-2-oxobutanoate hydroxymethyltransferase
MSKVNVTSKVTILDLQQMKAENRKITMLTAYDYTMARLVDAAGVDVVLVGDSLGMVVQGQENTLPVTLDQMIYHGRCVARGLRRAHLVVDMPFMSYHSVGQALENTARVMREGGAESVKLEGGQEVADVIAAVTRCGIPVMAHIGLTPQSVHAMGGFKVQGREAAEAERLKDDALAVQEAGAYSVVIEGVPMDLAAEISSSLTIPTIGIGAGIGCDGQVLVINDLLGLDEGFKPRFVKRYATLHSTIVDAVQDYLSEVRQGSFPDEAHSFRGRREREATSRSSTVRLTA